MRKITGCLIALALAFIALAASPTCASAAIYPTKEWTFRIKPDLLRDSIFFMDGVIVLESSNHTLNFISEETGEKLWQFGFYAPLKIYQLGESRLAVVSDGILHALDASGKEVIWSLRMKRETLEKLFISDDGSWLVAQYGSKSFETFNLKEKRKPSGATTPPAGVRELSPAAEQAFAPDVAGEGTSLEIEEKKAALKDKNGARWEFRAKSNLARTAAVYGGNRLALASSDGHIIFLSMQTGEIDGDIDVREFIKMRFWDESPESIDNYSESALIVRGNKIYLAGPSSFSRFSIKAFPDSISLTPEKKQDTTYGWALEKAISLWDSKNYNEALKGMEEVVRMWPDASEARLFLGMAYSTTGRTDDAIRELDTAHALDPDNPDIVSNLAGNCLVKVMSLDPSSKSEEIIELYKRVKALQPDNKMAHIGLVELLIGRKNYEAARAEAVESFNSGFFSADMNLLLLSAWYLQGNTAEALAVADEIIALFPALAVPRLIKGKLQCKSGAYVAAIKTFADIPPDRSSSASSLLPRYLTSGHRFFHANAIGLAGDYSNAAKKLEEYAAWIPAASDLKKLSSIYASVMENKDAKISAADRKLFEKYSGKNSMELEAEIEFREPSILAAAHFLILSGKKEKAFSLMKKMNVDVKYDPEIDSYLGYLYCLGGRDLARAAKRTETALSKDPDDPVFMRNNAVCLAARGDNKGAEAMFLKAISTSQDTELLRYEYGKLLLKLKKKKEAAEQFRLEIKASPDIKLPKDALAAIGG